MAHDSQVEEIKNRLNIVDVVGSYIKLTKAGANFRGVCPFHSEKKPSFFVSPARQIWHCFGCNEGSSIFDFVMKIEGIEFGDAIRMLAQKAGVELKRQDPRLRTARERLYEICDLACAFFEKQLESSVVGQEAKKYLLGRGIKDETIKKWRLGYSPEVWQGLSDFLVSRGYSRDEIEKAGLAIKSEKAQRHYDRFRGRIMFPVFDLNSQVVGFGGRVFKKVEGDQEQSKYINTPQTFLYDKSRTLYGLSFGKVATRKENKCVITEGYTDVIMAHQAGFENTVACSGTALTMPHLDILRRYTENLILAFDMDIAGDTATKRGINSAQEQGFNIKIIKQTEKDTDPADVILKNPEDWARAVAGARSILDYYFDSALENNDKAKPEGKKAIGRLLLPIIKRIPNMIEQSFWIQKLSGALSVGEDVILQELKKVKIEDSQFTENKVQCPVVTPQVAVKFIGSEGRKKMLEEKIIALILKDPSILNLIDVAHFPLFSEKVIKFLDSFKKFNLEQSIIDGPKDFSAQGGSLEAGKKGLADFIIKYSNGQTDANLNNFLAALSLRAEVEYEEDAEEEICLCLEELKDMDVRLKLKDLSIQIKQAEQQKDNQKLSELMEQFNKLAKEL